MLFKYYTHNRCPTRCSPTWHKLRGLWWSYCSTEPAAQSIHKGLKWVNCSSLHCEKNSINQTKPLTRPNPKIITHAWPKHYYRGTLTDTSQKRNFFDKIIWRWFMKNTHSFDPLLVLNPSIPSVRFVSQKLLPQSLTKMWVIPKP